MENVNVKKTEETENKLFLNKLHEDYKKHNKNLDIKYIYISFEDYTSLLLLKNELSSKDINFKHSELKEELHKCRYAEIFGCHLMVTKNIIPGTYFFSQEEVIFCKIKHENISTKEAIDMLLQLTSKYIENK